MSRRAQLTGACFLNWTLLLGGCRTTTGEADVTVQVRDQITHKPVEEAVVQAETVHFFVPIYPYPIVDFNPASNGLARTNELGIARLELPQNCPVRVSIVAAGYEPFEVYLTDAGIWPESGQWIDNEPFLGNAAGARLEAKFSP